MPTGILNVMKDSFCYQVQLSLTGSGNLAENTLKEYYFMPSAARRKKDDENVGLIQRFIDKKENK